jgi:hypothetical protein
MTPSGIYKYRRVIPEELREHFGKREIKKLFGKNYQEALRQYADTEAF